MDYVQICDILFIQESHFLESDQENLICEINGNFFHSFWSTQSKGESIWLRKYPDYTIINNLNDNEGRIIMVDVGIEHNIYTLVNIYAPNLPNTRNFKNIKVLMEKKSLGFLIIGGDINDTLTTKDSKTETKQTTCKSKRQIKKQLHT